MTKADVENEIFSIIQSINRACVKGAGFEKLADSLAEDFITYPPGFLQCAKGKEVNLQMYKDFCTKANIKNMSE